MLDKDGVTTIQEQAARLQAAQLQEKLVAMFRELHQHPELSNEEFETTRRIKTWLNEAGIRLLDMDVPTGALAEIGGHHQGPTIVLRADIDALPINELTDLPYASTVPGRMHACGHDFHTASMIGAALVLKRFESELKGRVRLLFQPAEEQADGAKTVIEAGALEGASAVFGMHNKPDLPIGTVGVRTGPLMASVDHFRIEVRGKGGHAAIPNMTIDPIVVSSAIVTALQTIVSRSISPLESAVISVGKMEAGSSWNVIPEHAHLEGTVRTFDRKIREHIPQWMKRVIEGVAAAHGAEAKLHWTAHQPAVTNDAQMAQLISSVAKAQGLEVVEAERTMAGEDFSLYQELVPGCFIWMGTNGPEQWHHPKFTVDERALSISAGLFAHTAINALAALQP